jgi:nucleoside-diphosphate-sugar epimerase
MKVWLRLRDAKHKDRAGVMKLFEQNRMGLAIHCAAQPSHYKAKEIPLVDFEVNALGTLNLLEATRRHSPAAVFIMMSAKSATSATCESFARITRTGPTLAASTTFLKKWSRLRPSM